MDSLAVMHFKIRALDMVSSKSAPAWPRSRLVTQISLHECFLHCPGDKKSSFLVGMYVGCR
jgi:hypothetical protein